MDYLSHLTDEEWRVAVDDAIDALPLDPPRFTDDEMDEMAADYEDWLADISWIQQGC